MVSPEFPGGPDPHHFVRSVASPGGPWSGRPQAETDGLEGEFGGRVSPGRLVLSSSPVWLLNKGESGIYLLHLSSAMHPLPVHTLPLGQVTVFSCRG